MSNLQRISNGLGGGTFARLMLPKIRSACEELGCTHGILTMGVLEFNRATNSEPPDLGGDGIIDVSPSPDEIRQAIGNAGSDAIAEANRDTWERVSHSTIERVVRALARNRLVDGQTLWCQGLHTGHRLPAETALRDFKRRQPRQFIIGLSTLPDEATKRENLRQGYDMFLSLKNDGVLDVTFLVDNASPFALTFRLDIQDRFVAKALASLLAAQVHFTRNPSMAEVGRALGTYGPYAGITFRSRSIPTDEAFWWKLLRNAKQELPIKGSAAMSNVVLEAKEATKQALTEKAALAIEEDINLRKPMFIIYTVPIRLEDQASWVLFGSEMRRWLGNTYPTATPIFVSGNGTPDPRYSGSYWVQVSVLFPMPPVPTPLRRVLQSEPMPRHFPAPSPESEHEPNGSGPASELAQPQIYIARR